LRLGDKRALGLLKAEAIRDVLCDRLYLNADPATGHSPMLFKLGNNSADGVRRDRKGDTDRAARRREDGGIDTDHVAIGIECRPAGIPFVDRRIDLDEVVIRTGADIATARRHDAGCDGTAKTKRIANRKHPVANAWGLVRELYVREWTIFALDQRQIGARIGADYLGFVNLAIVSRDLNAFSFLDDVVVGDRIAISGDKEARALAGNDVAATAARHAFRPIRNIRHPKTPEELAQSRRDIVATESAGLRTTVDFHAHRNDRRFDLLDDVGKTDRRLQLARLLAQILRDRSRITTG